MEQKTKHGHSVALRSQPASRIKRQRDRARLVLRQLLDTLDSCDTAAGFVWRKRDRREFLRLAGMK